MFLSKNLLKKHPEYRANYGIGLFLLIITVTVGVQFYNWLAPAETFSLLANAPGLVEVETIQKANDLSTISAIPLPKSENLYTAAVGVYTISSKHFPSGTIAVELALDDHRIFEVLQKPKTNLEAEIQKFAQTQQQDIVIAEVPAKIITMSYDNIDCLTANEDNPVGLCEITKVLMFEIDKLTISIGIDANHATEGELIEFAQNMIEQ
jgi:hypothetical protein